MKSYLLSLSLLLCAMAGRAQYHLGIQPITLADSTQSYPTAQAQVFYPANRDGTVAEGEFPVVLFAPDKNASFAHYNYLWRHFPTQGQIWVFPAPGVGEDPAWQQFSLARVRDYLLDANEKPGDAWEGRLNGGVMVLAQGKGVPMALDLIGTEREASTRTLVVLGPRTSPEPTQVEAFRSRPAPMLWLEPTWDCGGQAENNRAADFHQLADPRSWRIRLRDASYCQFQRGLETDSCWAGRPVECDRSPAQLLRGSQHQHILDLLDGWLSYYGTNNCDAYQEFLVESQKPNRYETFVRGNQTYPRAAFSHEARGRWVKFRGEGAGAVTYNWTVEGVDVSSSTDPIHVFSKDSGRVRLIVANELGCRDTIVKTLRNLTAVGWEEINATSDGKYVSLSWSSSSEHRVDSIYLERSNGISGVFEPILRVAARGAADQGSAYEWVDRTVGPGDWMYRVRALERNGRIWGGPTVTLTHQLTRPLDFARFSYVDRRLRFDILSEHPDYLQVALIDLSGRTCRSQMFHPVSGPNTVSLSLESLPSGIYALKLYQRQEVVTRMLWIK